MGVKKVCERCGIEFSIKPSHAARGAGRWCSRDCWREDQKVERIELECHQCGAALTRRKKEVDQSETKRFYCDRSCAAKVNASETFDVNARNWVDGATTYRSRALRVYGLKCMNLKCALQAAGVEIPEVCFDVDHIEGREGGHELENLQVLCVFCHRLKTLGMVIEAEVVEVLDCDSGLSGFESRLSPQINGAVMAKEGKKRVREQFRKAVFGRDKFKCCFCEETENLDAHHITDRNEMPNGGYVKENGISLCEEHHRMAEEYHSTGTALPDFHPEDLYKVIRSSKEAAHAASLRL